MERDTQNNQPPEGDQKSFLVILSQEDTQFLFSFVPFSEQTGEVRRHLDVVLPEGACCYRI